MNQKNQGFEKQEDGTITTSLNQKNQEEIEQKIQKILEEFDEKDGWDYYVLPPHNVFYSKEQIKQFLSSSLRKIAEERDKNLMKWFANYKGMCGEIFGYKDGEINFPEYGCQAEEIYNEMREAIESQEKKAKEYLIDK